MKMTRGAKSKSYTAKEIMQDRKNLKLDRVE